MSVILQRMKSKYRKNIPKRVHITITWILFCCDFDNNTRAIWMMIREWSHKIENSTMLKLNDKFDSKLQQRNNTMSYLTDNLRAVFYVIANRCSVDNCRCFDSHGAIANTQALKLRCTITLLIDTNKI